MQGLRTTPSCLNCKQRRKGCDHGRPSCSRCKRLGISCRYEQRRYHFVDATTGAISPIRSRAVVSSITFTLEASNQSDAVSRAANSALTTAFSDCTPSINTPGSLLKTSHELQCMSAFWQIFLPANDQLDGSIGGMTCATWMPAVQLLATTDDCTRDALSAVAFVGLGWYQDEQSLIDRGIQTYARTLRMINRALHDPIKARSDTVLACARVLSLFQMFRGSSRSILDRSQAMDWRRHTAGSFDLIRIRGRKVHESGVGFLLFDGVRLTGIVQGMLRRQKNVFTELAWRIGDNIDLRGRLLNIMIDAPGLLQRFDTIKATLYQDSGSKLVDCQALLQELMRVADSLHQWEVDILQLCYDKTATGYSTTDERQLFAQCWSHGYALFFACEQYWAACIHIHSTIEMLHKMMTALPQVGQLPGLASWINSNLAASYIAQTAHLYFTPEAGLWAAQASVFPLSTAMIYYVKTGRTNSAELRTIRQAYDGNKSGRVMKAFLESVQTPRCKD